MSRHRVSAVGCWQAELFDFLCIGHSRSLTGSLTIPCKISRHPRAVVWCTGFDSWHQLPASTDPTSSAPKLSVLVNLWLEYIQPPKTQDQDPDLAVLSHLVERVSSGRKERAVADTGCAVRLIGWTR